MVSKRIESRHPLEEAELGVMMRLIHPIQSTYREVTDMRDRKFIFFKLASRRCPTSTLPLT
jgi:hypothetical protein